MRNDTADAKRDRVIERGYRLMQRISERPSRTLAECRRDDLVATAKCGIVLRIEGRRRGRVAFVRIGWHGQRVGDVTTADRDFWMAPSDDEIIVHDVTPRDLERAALTLRLDWERTLPVLRGALASADELQREWRRV